MLTAGDALAKTLAKSQKVTFWSQKNDFGCFFFGSLLWMLLYLFYETYTCVTELILVFQILYLYYGAYTCITNLILVLRSLFLYFEYGSIIGTTEHFTLYKSTCRYYRIDTEVPVCTFRSLPYSFLYSYSLFRVLIHTSQIRFMQIRTLVRSRYKSHQIHIQSSYRFRTYPIGLYQSHIQTYTYSCQGI